MLPVGAAILSGILLFAAFPAYDLSLLAWFALVPLFLVFARVKPLYGIFLSFIFGVVFYTGLFYWMFYLPGYRVLHHVLLGVYLCPLLGVFAGLFFLSARKWGINAALFSTPFVWVALEYLRSNLSFLSLPWGLLAHCQYQHPLLIQIAGITGVYGISFLIILVNAGITAILYPGLFRKKSDHPVSRVTFPRRAGLALAVSTAVLLTANLFYGYMTILKPIEGRRIKLSAIQGNIEQSRKWDPKYAATIMRIYTELTQEASRQNPSLIVWPEAATPKSVHRNRGFFKRIKDLAAQTRTPILLGSSQLAKFKVTDPHKKARYLNSAFLFGRGSGGNMQQRYDKMVLLPFSEYLPYKNTIPWKRLHIPESNNFLSGKKHTVFALPPDRFAVVICWENIFPHHVRQFVANGAQFLINITNEAWFGRTAAPYQFLSMNVFRAVENHRYLLRCANTGISCFIDPHGRIISRVEDESGNDLFVRGILTGTVIPLIDRTFYNRHGGWFAWLCIIYSLLYTLLVFIPFRSMRSPG